MERLEAAMAKARSAREAAKGNAPAARPAATPGQAAAPQVNESDALWAALEEIEISPKLARSKRLSSLMGSEQAAPYDILRTRVLRQMREQGWKRLVVTSPNKACGKTTLSLNLALSIARRADLRVVLFDFDLRRPSLSGVLGRGSRAPELAQLLSGETDFATEAVRFGRNLAIVANRRAVPNPAETLLAPETVAFLNEIEARYAPDVMIFDTPPMIGIDDNLAFLGQVDCALLVAAAESTTAAQADTAERELAGITNVLGTVMNKCRYLESRDGYGSDY